MKDKKYRTNPWVHTLYLNVILLTVLFFTIVIMSKHNISESAMANVSFAATIVSIVLAVISIVISVVASFKTYQNLGGMQDVASRMNVAISKLNKIGKNVTLTGKKVESVYNLLRPTSQSEINGEAEKTIADINAESSTEKKIFTVEDIKRYERKVVEIIANEKGLSDLKLDCHLDNIPRQFFDGIAKKGNVNWLIEVKLFRPDLVSHLISRLKKTRLQVIAITEEPVEIIVGYLLTETSDKAKITEAITPRFEENDIQVEFYSLNELEHKSH